MRTREWASQRLDGELSELERLLLRRHLARCSECRVFAQSIAGATAVIRATPGEEPSRPLAPAGRAPRDRPARRRRRQLAIVFALVTVSAAIGGVVGGLVSSGDESPPVITIVEVDPPPAPETGPTGNV